MDIISIAHAATEVAAESHETGVAGMFGINLKIFIAQLINFGIVLFVLSKWVFGPIAKKLTDRANMIEKSVIDANKIAEEKQEFEEWRKQQMGQAKSEAAKIITDARVDAETLKAEILEVTKAEQRKIVADTQEELRGEKTKAVQAAKSEIASLIVTATEKILRGKLDAQTDLELVKKSIKEVIA